MNEINAAQRKRVAAQELAESHKTIKIAKQLKPEEKRPRHLHGVGLPNNVRRLCGWIGR